MKPKEILRIIEEGKDIEGINMIDILRAGSYYYYKASTSHLFRRKNTKRAAKIYLVASTVFQEPQTRDSFIQKSINTYETMASISKGKKREYFLKEAFKIKEGLERLVQNED